ncbi:AGAP009249-PA-like protein [Anopheles sinensis]|uniref:AGAP009249-PA-like protein n=1 Tax=Anopheles sinensis TaxID=74873 RepID=A0A084VB52_ANOSI|nr:AGAP009249-PA-like protein [Anopheles sinensis]
MFLVPEVCELKFGAAVQSEFRAFNRHEHDVHALNLLGRDCGFGESALGVKISSHKKWLSSVLLKQKRQDIDSAQFFDTDLEIGDHCRMPDGNTGMCTDVQRCPKVQYDFSTQKQVTFCSNGSIVCCPFHNMLNATNGAVSELNACATNYKSFHKRSFLPHMIKIQRNISNKVVKSCVGTLITQSVAVASASCLSHMDIISAIVILDWEKTSPQMSIKKIIFHPEFQASMQQNDIGLVTIDGTVDPKSGKIPACVWQNQTHIPALVNDGRNEH